MAISGRPRRLNRPPEVAEAVALDLPVLEPKRKKRNDAKIPASIKRAVHERDNYTCRYCRRGPLEGDDLTTDHVTPRAQGGKNTKKNLVTSCRSCNKEKRDRTDVRPGRPNHARTR